MISEIVLPDRDRHELGADSGRHLLGLSFLVILRGVEGQSERPDRAWMMPCGKTQYRAGVETAAEITADRHIRPQAHPYGVIQRGTEFRRVVGIGTTCRVGIRSRVVEIPVPLELQM